MATVVTRYVDPNADTGGNGTTNELTGANCAYQSLSAWNTARARNLVSADEIERVICCSNHANHTADTTPSALSGWTTDATRYVQIEAEVNHGGKWNPNVYRLEINAGSGEALVGSGNTNHFRIYGIQIKYTSTSHFTRGLDLRDSSVCRVWGCLIWMTGGDYVKTGIVPAINQATGYYWNNIIINDSQYNHNNCGGLITIQGSTAVGTNYIFNNTIIGGAYGILTSNDTKVNVVKNNLIKGTATADLTLYNYSDSGYNATEDATGDDYGSGGRANQTFTFVDEANDDYHLAANDAGAKGYGVADPGSGLFSDDIDGQTRGATWDIGADQYVAEGGGGGLDAFLQAIFTKTPSIDGLLNKAGLMRTTDIDSLLQKVGLTRDASIDAILFAVITYYLTGSLDAYLQKTEGRNTSLDALLQALAQTKTTGADGLLQKEFTKAPSIDAALNKSGMTKTAGLDAALNAVGLTRTASMDSLLNAVGLTREASLDALLLALSTKETGLDAILFAAAGPGTQTTSIDALLSKLNLTGSASIDAFLQRSAIERTASLDALLLAQQTRTVGADAFLSKSFSQASSLDALIYLRGLLDVGIDGLLSQTGAERSAGLDAILYVIGQMEFSASIDAFLARPARAGIDAILVGGSASYVVQGDDRGRSYEGPIRSRAYEGPTRKRIYTVH